MSYAEYKQTLTEAFDMAKAEARGWTIYFDPPPIPTRTDDYRFVHRDFDADYDDGWVGNGLCGTGASVADCLAQIREIEAEHPHFQKDGAQ